MRAESPILVIRFTEVGGIVGENEVVGVQLIALVLLYFKFCSFLINSHLNGIIVSLLKRGSDFVDIGKRLPACFRRAGSRGTMTSANRFQLAFQVLHKLRNTVNGFKQETAYRFLHTRM